MVQMRHSPHKQVPSVSEDTIDKALVRRSCNGDGEAFDTLIERHIDTIYRVACRLLDDRADAADLTQEVCLLLARNLNSFKGTSKFATWLHRMTANRATDWIRRELRRLKAEKGYEDARQAAQADRLARAQGRLWLAEAMKGMSQELVEVVDLKLQGYTHEEIATRLGSSPGTAAWRYSKALKEMEQLVDGKEDAS